MSCVERERRSEPAALIRYSHLFRILCADAGAIFKFHGSCMYSSRHRLRGVLHFHFLGSWPVGPGTPPVLLVSAGTGT